MTRDVLRLDIWLDVACIFKTRAEAQRACKGGKVFLNRHRGKPHQAIHLGDMLEITIPGGQKRQLSVTGLADAHIPKAKSRELYDDITPTPTSQEQELRDLLRLAGPVPGAKTRHHSTPDHRNRRAIRELKSGY
jgi:ribosome-associated heat shock protein Hsp15